MVSKSQNLKEFHIISTLSKLRSFTTQLFISRYLNNFLNSKYNKGSKRERAPSSFYSNPEQTALPNFNRWLNTCVRVSILLLIKLQAGLQITTKTHGYMCILQVHTGRTGQGRAAQTLPTRTFSALVGHAEVEQLLLPPAPVLTETPN